MADREGEGATGLTEREVAVRVLEGLDEIARNYDNYEYGLPLYNDEVQERLVAVVVQALESDRDRLKAALETVMANREGDERVFPIQRERGARTHPMTVPWSVAEKAYSVYSSEYGTTQSLERLAARGGFAPSEMDQFHPTWRDESGEIARLKSALEAEREGRAHAERVHAVQLRQYEVALSLAENRCQALQAQLAVPPAQWQPMETAPKDETRVLLICANQTVPQIGRWFAWGGFWESRALAINPTHWMPLPAAPVEAPQPTVDPPAQLIADILQEYADELTKEACDNCEQCGEAVMCSFHSVLSLLSGDTWTSQRLARHLIAAVPPVDRQGDGK